MRRGWTVVALLAVLALAPAAAQARGRGGRSGKVYGPGGLMYDTNSREWKAAGGNIQVYQQMMMQKAMVAQQKVMVQQQQQMVKQQQAFQKWLKDQKAKKDKGQPTDPAYDRYVKMVDQQNAMMLKQTRSYRSPAQRAAARKSSSKSKSSSKTKSESESETGFGSESK